MVAKPKLDPRGMKRICTECGNRFYDLNKRPIICPACDAEFTGETKVKTRRGRGAANDAAEGQVDKKTAKDDAQEEDLEEDDGPIMEDDDDTMSINDLDEGDDDSDDDDIDLDMDDDLGDLDDLEPDADDLDELDGDDSDDNKDDK